MKVILTSHLFTSPFSILSVCIFLFMPILFVSCSQKKTGSESKKVISEINKSKKIDKSNTIYNSTTGNVDGHSFTVITTSAYYLFVLDDKKDTLYQDSVYSPHQKFVDFNGDGYKDILIEYMTNVPGIQDLLLYDSAKKTYKKVIDLQNFPASQRIGNSKYYYSYHRSGCADSNWDSDLFYIENYKTVKIGNISGRECGDTDIKDGIYINRIVGETKTLIDDLPINTINQYKEFKWGFIKQYWQKNYKKFL